MGKGVIDAGFLPSAEVAADILIKAIPHDPYPRDMLEITQLGVNC